MEADWKEEYRECGINFRDGYKLIFDIVKLSVTINAFLFASYAALSQLIKPTGFSLSLFLVCIIGVLTCLCTWVGHTRIGQYTQQFLKRAKEIEELHELALYKRAYKFEMEGREKLLNNYRIPRYAYVVVGVIWVLLILISLGVTNINIPI